MTVPPLLRYGKYCGILYSGCPGERPCDDLDACCMNHDLCVQAKNSEFSSLLYILYLGFLPSLTAPHTRSVITTNLIENLQRNLHVTYTLRNSRLKPKSQEM
jgi:hypothetical protein